MHATAFDGLADDIDEAELLVGDLLVTNEVALYLHEKSLLGGDVAGHSGAAGVEMLRDAIEQTLVYLHLLVDLCVAARGGRRGVSETDRLKT